MSMSTSSMASLELKDSEPFLARYSGDEEAPHYQEHYENSKAKKSQDWMNKRNLAIHAVLILLYTITSITIIRHSRPSTCRHEHENNEDTLPYSLPVPFTQKLTTFHNLSQTPYAGDKPAEDLDAAWEKLLKPMNMRFSKQELERVNQDSVALPQGGGYLGWYGVFHELHCVKMLRHSFERARQYNSTDAESKKDKGHVDHCIELLRQSAVCRPDTSLTTFIWHPSTPLPMFNVSESVHTCVDWDAFMETSRSRVVSEEEIDGLVNPLLGKG